jgi:hypothetical protein
MAMAKTTTGSTIGVSSRPRSTLRPRNCPLTRAKEASSPMTTARSAAMAAMRALVSAASSHAGSANSSPYHFSVQLGGGKANHRDEPNDKSTMKTTGSSRNAATRPVKPSSAARSQPSRS